MNEIKMQLETWRGYSAFEVAVQNGFKGTEAEWLNSLKGRDGGVAKVNGIGHDAAGNVVITGENVAVGTGDSRTLKEVVKDVDNLSKAVKATDTAVDIGGRYIDNARFR